LIVSGAARMLIPDLREDISLRCFNLCTIYTDRSEERMRRDYRMRMRTMPPWRRVPVQEEYYDRKED